MPDETRVKAGYSTPMLHVTDVEKSIAFYELLGFTLVDTEGKPPGWARLHCEGGAIMLLVAEHPVDTSGESIMLVMYTPDLPALRNRLLGQGIHVPAITYPDYMPSGQVCFRDPDGYLISINHWGAAEHQAWLKKIGAAAAAVAEASGAAMPDKKAS